MEALDLIVKIFSFKHSVVLLSIVLMIVLVIKSKDFIEILNWIFKKKSIRGCADCILIMFGIREKYELESNKISHSILRSQMSYFEQKSQELLLCFIQSFLDDIENLGKDVPQEIKSSQIANYQESLKCAFGVVKDEVRKAFKNNGFSSYSDSEYTNYVKSKTKTLISIVKSYLNTYYVQNEKTIVSLKYRFEKLDSNYLYDMTFDLFNKARTIVQEADQKEAEIKESFKKELTSFIEKNNN
jgi:hypothetical protein